METGLCPDRFWRLTPKQVEAEFLAATKRQKSNYNEMAWLAWHVAALSRTKVLPDLKEMISETSDRKPTRRRTWQEMAADAQAMVNRMSQGSNT